jgi:hypothetical protein
MINIQETSQITKIYLVENCYGDPNKVYIGKTKNCRKAKHLRTYGDKAKYFYIDEVDSLEYKDWIKLERFWIEQFRQWGFQLMNGNNGGGGPSFCSEESKLKLRIKNKGKPKPQGFGKNISKVKLSQNLVMSQETKDKISKSKTNHPCFQTKSFKEKHSKPINQLDKNGDIINSFKSIEAASNSNIKFKRSNISCCLTGFSKSAYGYKWEYKNL